MEFLPRIELHDVERMVAIAALGGYFLPLCLLVSRRHVGKRAVKDRVVTQDCCGIVVLGSLLIVDDWLLDVAR